LQARLIRWCRKTLRHEPKDYEPSNGSRYEMKVIGFDVPEGFSGSMTRNSTTLSESAFGFWAFILVQVPPVNLVVTERIITNESLALDCIPSFRGLPIQIQWEQDICRCSAQKGEDSKPITGVEPVVFGSDA